MVKREASASPSPARSRFQRRGASPSPASGRFQRRSASSTSAGVRFELRGASLSPAGGRFQRRGLAIARTPPVEDHVFDKDGDLLLQFTRSQAALNVDGEPPSTVHMRVSSKHMIMASKVFETMLRRDGFRAGAALAEHDHVELPLPDDDAEAFTILLNIIHGQNKKVPRQVTLDMLTKLAVIVDKYRLQEAIEMFSELWIAHLNVDLGDEEYEKHLFQWLTISWVFGIASVFESATEYAQLHATCDFGKAEAIGLPTPESVVATIKKKRLQILNSVYSHIDAVIKDWQEFGVFCSRGDDQSLRPLCDAMVLGGLITECKANGLWPTPDAQKDQQTLMKVFTNGLAIQFKSLCDVKSPYADNTFLPSYCFGHGGPGLIHILLRVERDNMCGLKLHDFVADKHGGRQ